MSKRYRFNGTIIEDALPEEEVDKDELRKIIRLLESCGMSSQELTSLLMRSFGMSNHVARKVLMEMGFSLDVFDLVEEEEPEDNSYDLHM